MREADRRMVALPIDPGLFIWSLLTMVLVVGMVLVPAAGVGLHVGRTRGVHPVLGLALGLLLSWAGVVVVLLLGKGRRTTPPRETFRG